MPRRIPKRAKLMDLADAVAAMRVERVPRRAGGRRKDGSIPTAPVVKTDQSEREVLAGCLALLKRRRVKADRLNNGSFQTTSGWHYYGIPGAGDIVGLLPGGRHLEIECKAGRGGALSFAQQKRMRDIRENGGLYWVVHSTEDLEHCLNEVSDEIAGSRKQCRFEDLEEGTP